MHTENVHTVQNIHSIYCRKRNSVLVCYPKHVFNSHSTRVATADHVIQSRIKLLKLNIKRSTLIFNIILSIKLQTQALPLQNPVWALRVSWLPSTRRSLLVLLLFASAFCWFCFAWMRRNTWRCDGGSVTQARASLDDCISWSRLSQMSRAHPFSQVALIRHPSRGNTMAYFWFLLLRQRRIKGQRSMEGHLICSQNLA